MFSNQNKKLLKYTEIFLIAAGEKDTSMRGEIMKLMGGGVSINISYPLFSSKAFIYLVMNTY